MNGCAKNDQSAVEIDQEAVSADMVKEKDKRAIKIGKSKICAYLC